MPTRENGPVHALTAQAWHAEKPLGDHSANRENIRNSPRKSVQVYDDGYKRPGMHKKTKSSVSLKSLIGGDKVKSSRPSTQDSEDGVKLKRPKSSTALSALIAGTKSPKKSQSDHKSPTKEKENLTPPQIVGIAAPPIWAQFASQQPQNLHTGARAPLNGRIDLERETALYMPQDYSPSKQRNFHEYRPTLTRKPDLKPRPRSEFIDSSPTRSSVAETISGVRWQLGSNKTSPSQDKRIAVEERAKENCDPSSVGLPPTPRPLLDTDRNSRQSIDAATAAAKVVRGSRVMAAVAAFNGAQAKVCDSATTQSAVEILDVKAIEKEFESLLVG